MYVRMLLPLLIVGVAGPTVLAQGRRSKRKAVSKTKPWEEGVSKEQRSEALKLFRDANEAYGQLDFKKAVSDYSKALELWSHPRIHGNLVAALIQLEQYEDALTHVKSAIRFGEEPFSRDVYLTLLNNKRAVENKLATVEVSCSVRGAKVTLDNELFFVCPGKSKKIVRTGPHKIVAEKDGYVTTTRDVNAFSKGEYSIEIEPIPLEEVTKLERRWPTAMPWAVIGGGVLVAAAGVPFYLRAKDNIEFYDTAFGVYCQQQGGVDCSEFGENGFAELGPNYAAAAERRDSSRWQNIVSGSAFAVGAVAVVTGAVLVYLNQPKAVTLEQEANAVSLTPWLGPENAGVMITLGF